VEYYLKYVREKAEKDKSLEAVTKRMERYQKLMKVKRETLVEYRMDFRQFCMFVIEGKK
jgi:hypothetical protein